MKFAHIADCHLGAWNKTIHKENNLQAFETTIQHCITENVDFIIIAGDLFHSNIPDFEIADKAFEILKKCKDNGIPVYMVYGSHDRGLQKGTIDLLHTSGIVRHLPQPELYHPKFVKDEKTGALISGIDGKSGSVESELYAHINRGYLTAQEGFKIFVYHSTIKDFMPWSERMIPGISLYCLPKGFDYYAGGHIHSKSVNHEEDYSNIAMAGCLYGSNYADLEGTAKGDLKGFNIVTFDGEVTSIDFIPINVGGFFFKEFNVDGLHPNEVNHLFEEFNEDVMGEIVLIQLKGTLKGGDVNQIAIKEFRESLKLDGAVDVNISISRLKNPETSDDLVVYENESTKDIESRIFGEQLVKFDEKHPEVHDNLFGETGGKGEFMATDLLDVLRQPKYAKEKKEDYQNRILKESVKVLGVKE